MIPFNLKSLHRLEALSQFCPLIPNPSGNEENVMEYESIYDTIYGMSPNQNSVLYESGMIYANVSVNFEPIFTHEGLCFTTNSINSHELYSDK